jgi:hypothetical protein
LKNDLLRTELRLLEEERHKTVKELNERLNFYSFFISIFLELWLLKN